MVKNIEKSGKRYYLCSNCGFAYGEETTAQQCEDFCNKHRMCSREITKKAVPFD